MTPELRAPYAKVRWPSGRVEKRRIYRHGTEFFLKGQNGLRQRTLIPVTPPEDYKGRRSDGLVEWQVYQ